MSQQDLTNPGGIYEEKPRSNIYTAMLGIAFMALCAASGLLALELQDYDFDLKADNARKVSPRSAEQQKRENAALAPGVEGSLDAGTPDASATPPAATTPDASAPAAMPATPPAGVPAVPAATPAVPGAATPGLTPPVVPTTTPAATPATPAAPTTPAAPGAAVPGAPAVPGAAPAAGTTPAAAAS